MDTDAHKGYTLLGEDTENYRAVILKLPKDKETAAGTYNAPAHWPDDNPIAHVRFSDWLINDEAQKGYLEYAEKQYKEHVESPRHLALLDAQRDTPFAELTAPAWALQKDAAKKADINPYFYTDEDGYDLDFSDLGEDFWDEFQEEVDQLIAIDTRKADVGLETVWKYRTNKFIQDTLEMENPKVLNVEEYQSDVHAEAARWVDDDPSTGQRVGYRTKPPVKRGEGNEDFRTIEEVEEMYEYNQSYLAETGQSRDTLEDELQNLQDMAELEVPGIWQRVDTPEARREAQAIGWPYESYRNRRLEEAGVDPDVVEAIRVTKADIEEALNIIDHLEAVQARISTTTPEGEVIFNMPSEGWDSGVPDMPFKSTGKRGGKGWKELDARRILIEAAKGDYDVILLPTGREQIYRYKNGYRKVENAGIKTSELEAREVSWQEIRRKDPAAMLKDYDSVLVSHFNNVGRLLGLTQKQAKKYETSKVIDVPGGSEFGHQSESQPAPHSKAFSRWGNRMRLFIITPEMKEDILRGVPQFYAGGLMKRKAFRTGGKVLNTLRRARN